MRAKALLLAGCVLSSGFMSASAQDAFTDVSRRQDAFTDVSRRVDVSKRGIELPVEKTLLHGSAPAPSGAKTTAQNPNRTGGKVQPGLVRWHKNFEAACAASRQSKKPVLLFQMMGKLDDEFC